MQNTPLNAINDKILRLEKEVARLAAQRAQLEAMEGTPGVPRIVSKDPRKLSSWLPWSSGGKTKRRRGNKKRKSKRR